MITRIRAEVKTVVDRPYYHGFTAVSAKHCTSVHDNKKANHDFKDRD